MYVYVYETESVTDISLKHELKQKFHDEIVTPSEQSQHFLVINASRAYQCIIISGGSVQSEGHNGAWLSVTKRYKQQKKDEGVGGGGVRSGSTG